MRDAGACGGSFPKHSSKIKKAISYAGKKKAKIVEGYPVDLMQNKNYSDTFAYHGTKSAFEAAGFREVLRRSETRPVMRYYIK